MQCTRRNFMKLTAIGAAGLSLGQLGLDLRPVQAYAASLKIEGAKEITTICPFCSVSCGIIGYVKDGKLVSTEGDAEHPINQGSLCAKGAAMLTMTTSHHRLHKPLYRAPYSEKWEEKDWEWTLGRIAELTKETRDRDFMAKNAKGETVNRVESMIFMGTSHAGNEECSLMHQATRGLGIVHNDHQARI